LPGFLVLFAATLSAQQVDAGFANRAHKHVEALAALGPRLPGSTADRNAEEYVARQMRRAGLAVAIERFEFEYFQLDGAEIAAGGTTEPIERIIVDPYQGRLDVTGVPLFVSPEDLQAAENPANISEGRILVAAPGTKLFQLRSRAPAAAAIVSQRAFDRLRALGPAEVTIRMRGRVQRVATSNVIGTAGKGARGFLVFTAHRDSVEESPGADDNASGLAVLLELGRTWKDARIDRPARFIALAAEERGFVGAKAYVSRHRDELKQCALAFNLDSIGAEDGIWLDANGGVQGVEPGWQPVIRAEVGRGATWVMAPQFPRASNVPAWLKDAIVSASRETGIAVEIGQFSSSDHLVFARAGVPATHVSSSTPNDHTPQDLAASVSGEALARAARLVLAVARKVK
jgi:hypothetical protein